MQDNNAPAKIPLIWGANADPAYINTIPTGSQIAITPGRASFNDGFVPLSFVARATGGAGPFGKDFNGILNQVTAGLQWLQAGGPTYYDATFSAAIGGYPEGAVVMSSVTNGMLWLSTADNNTNNPDVVSTGWEPLFPTARFLAASNLSPFYVQGAASTYTVNVPENVYAVYA